MSFNVRKASQSVAYFCLLNGGHPVNVLKSAKLIYLADRESIAKSGFPIQEGDSYASLPRGPISSKTTDYIRGEIKDRGEWGEYVSDRENHMIGLSKPNIARSDLDELSDFDIEILRSVYEKFKSYDQWQLEKWTHVQENVPEWKDPNGSCLPIELIDIMEALGIENAEMQAQMVQSFK